MTQLPPTAMIAIGAVIAATIAGAFSYLNLVISKDQKVSELRQHWIDSLRKDIAQYCASVVFLSYAHEMLEEDGPEKPSSADYLKAIEVQMAKGGGAYTSIILRINPDDKNHKLKDLNNSFLETLIASRAALRADEFNTAKALCDKLQVQARPILKTEWDRVRDGEPVFRATRWMALVVIVAALVSGCYMAVKTYSGIQ